MFSAISDTELLCALHFCNSKNICNPLIFSKNGYLLMFLAGPKVKTPSASKLASDFRPFDPGIIILHFINIEEKYNYA